MFDLAAIQKAIRDFGFEGWLLFDFRGSNPLARRVLELEGKPVGSRRWLYWIPAQGHPVKLVHRIETSALDHLPGSKQVYLTWGEFESQIAEFARGRKIAMEYSHRNANPYVSRVDGGIVDLARESGATAIGCSGDLIQLFEATWDDEQWASHLEADRHTRSAYDLAFGMIAERVKAGHAPMESEVQALILDHFHKHRMTTYSGPIVAVGQHSGDPHYETTKTTDVPIREGDFVLIDLWAKMDRPRAVYSDLTRVAYVGATVPHEIEEVFQVVARARDAAILHVREAFAHRRPLPGWEVDDAARSVIEAAGHGDSFIHRTGHNIGQETHGNGAHMDNLETREERLVLPRTCFSIEPGIYLDRFGVRSEINVFIDKDGEVHVTGGPLQQHVLALLA